MNRVIVTKKSNFKKNLLIGFSTSMLILIISSVASFVSISNLLESAGWVNHTNKVIIEMNTVMQGLVDAETGQRGFLITKNRAFLDPYNNSRKRVMDSYQDVKALTIDNPVQQNRTEDLGKLIDERFFYLEQTLKAKEQGIEPKTEDLLKGQEVMERTRELIHVMEETEGNLLNIRTESMNRFASFTPILIIVAAAVALLITIMFYVRVRNDFDERLLLQQELQTKDADITNRIKIIQNIADKISQGSYDIRIDDQQSDALGAVSGSLNKMAESLQYSFGLLSEKEWLQTGIARLNDIMIGEKDIHTLGTQIIEFLSFYTGSHAGAIYLLENDELCISGGYAFVPDASRRRIKRNEGILGQSIVTGKYIELKDIPADSINISYATGEVKPRHIIAVPVYDGYVLKGAIELSTLASYSPQHIEFLLACAPNIGIAISTAQNRHKLQELLEETQAQSEELKTQHSELENLNSELEVQTEKLQASEEEMKVQQEELRHANQELEERSRALEEKNQLIVERNLEIQVKADQLAQSTRYKSEFLANMSHELRTPLNSILLLSRLMTENQEQNLTPDQVEYARVIQSSGQGLRVLIDEILDLSKIESGKMQLEYQTVTLKEIVHDMYGLFSHVAGEKNIEFNTSIADSVPESIETDKLRLEQIIRNLLSNAIKFTEKGYVTLMITNDELRNDHVKFTVIDTGIGIPKEKQTLVFEAFQQADGSTRRKYGGTGLGLSISRELVKLLGGDISLKSNVDKGSEFSISVPVAKLVAERSAQGSKHIKPDQQQYLPADPTPVRKKYLSTHIPESIPDDRVSIKQADNTILIIEDDVNFAKSLLEFTHKRGYKGIVSVRGDEGIELARQFLPTGILLDIQLPVKSGLEVMEELKSDPETRHIPIHIMSSHEVKSESLLKGAVDFINKPMAFEQIQEIFKKIEYVLLHHPKKVLIVEENPRHAKALAYFLETFDISLEIKNQVEDAIGSLQENDLDCVILDMGIPDQKSYDMLDVVKRTPGLENLPIIIFTGKSLSQAEELKIKQYADSIVVKTAHSYKRILDEISLFLHLMEKNQPKEISSSKYHKLGALDEVLKNKKVLIADDDMRNIFSLTKALEKYQMNVIAAVDGKDALQKLKANPGIDIVLMDMMMPEMDGYETTMAIRNDARYRDLPVIAVTAKAMMGDKAKCINAGASDYITKPVDIDQLLSLLRVWLYESGQK